MRCNGLMVSGNLCRTPHEPRLASSSTATVPWGFREAVPGFEHVFEGLRQSDNSLKGPLTGAID